MADEEKKVTIEVPAKGGEPPADDSGVPKVKQTVLTKAEKEKLAKEKEEEMVRAPRRAVARLWRAHASLAAPQLRLARVSRALPALCALCGHVRHGSGVPTRCGAR